MASASDIFCLDVQESISCVGMKPSEGKRKGCKESRKESEKVVKEHYTLRENDVCSFIVLTSEFGKVGKGANCEKKFLAAFWKDRKTLSKCISCLCLSC